MSQENVELIRRAFQAFDDRDSRRAAGGPGPRTWRRFPDRAGWRRGYSGHEGVRRWLARLLGTFPDFRRRSSSWSDLSIDRGPRMRGHVAGSDTPVDARLASSPVTRGEVQRMARLQTERGTRSRGAVGVGDVAGERGSRCGTRWLRVARCHAGESSMMTGVGWRGAIGEGRDTTARKSRRRIPRAGPAASMTSASRPRENRGRRRPRSLVQLHHGVAARTAAPRSTAEPVGVHGSATARSSRRELPERAEALEAVGLSE